MYINNCILNIIDIIHFTCVHIHSAGGHLADLMPRSKVDCSASWCGEEHIEKPPTVLKFGINKSIL